MEAAGNPALQIVLAEDNAADVRLVRMALSKAGLDYALHVLEDGEQAIAFIRSLDENSRTSPIDLMLLDMHLPRHDGEDILKYLRSTERCGQVPVIVMTASDAPHDHDTAEKHAVMHYFRKPGTLDEFMQLGMIVRGVLNRKKPAENESAAPPARGGAA